MSCGGEAAHVGADLQDDRFGAKLVDAGVGAHNVDGDAKGREIGLDFAVQHAKRGIEPIDLLQMELQQEPMLARHVPPSASASLACGDFTLRRAKAASRTGSVSPATKASSIARPLFPSMSESSASILRLASSNTL